jgi:tetratricopeptide (TPR) repeat protein
LWEDSIASNLSSLEIQPDYHHAMDFIAYAHLQLAQDAKARSMIDEIYRSGRDELLLRDDLPTLGSYTALAVIPARYLLERGDWKGAAALPAVPTKRSQATSMIQFVRGLGMARSGDLAGAKGEIEAILTLRSALVKSGQSYWADRSEEQALAVSAWVALAEGKRELASKLMRGAADGEDSAVKHVSMENRLYPMRELLADLLLEMGEAGPALREYETSLVENRNRYRAYWGAARAAEAAGDRTKAKDYFAKLVELSKNADSVRPELARAKAYLAQR